MGTVAIGGGTVLATGAFDTVEADRSVDIETASDDTALLGLEILSETLSGADEAVIEFDLDTLNVSATTEFEDALAITNNGEREVTVSIRDGSDELLDADGAPMAFDHDDLASGETSIELGIEQTAKLDVSFDVTTSDPDEDIGIPETITIVAETDEE
ncbi:hypothetical protein C490_03663 [Natronobacterium gregoryi SP2]|uniref:DUF1102 domain-containing protein n=1 Tax=Natronobacterium gregoryi (strain ATCC 43098 / DSM 3393 / CCM 3738 / CIP 104747 / IAM 13177 / JCM 8860 / NBRC 102187 / NCIMB 2189 / SP2) TaxID=797304 RepID=L9YEB4_NATGS|nr:hypothetical protein C490_03663 [Natronobacterium gregoryi SP2]